MHEWLFPFLNVTKGWIKAGRQQTEFPMSNDLWAEPFVNKEVERTNAFGRGGCDVYEI